MDESFDNQAQETSHQLNQAADQSWQNLNTAANQAAEQTQAAAEQAYQGWQAPAVTPQAPRQYAPNDPNRWTGELYTPEIAPSQSYQQTPGSPYINAQNVNAQTPPPVQKDKDKFPVWAIVLIVLLVICICVVCTIVPLALIGKGIAEGMRF